MNEVGELVTVAVPATELPCSELNRWVRTIGDPIPEGWETAPALEAEWPPQAATATGTIIVNNSRLYIFVVSLYQRPRRGSRLRLRIAFAIEPRHCGWMRRQVMVSSPALLIAGATAPRRCEARPLTRRRAGAVYLHLPVPLLCQWRRCETRRGGGPRCLPPPPRRSRSHPRDRPRESPLIMGEWLLSGFVTGIPSERGRQEAAREEVLVG